MKKKANRYLDWLNKSNHCNLKMEKKQLVKYNLILRIEYHDKEGDKGSFFGGQHTLTHKNPWRKERNIKSIAI
jgi:hypothetical protein